MNARSEQDTNLGWVKSELDDTLTLARQALEVYVENPNDGAQLRFVTTHLHQVVGTLQIVELYGAALLAEEAELVVNALIKGDIKALDDAYEVIMRAILQLPIYLDHIQQGYKDNPVSLLPLMNDLRTIRGQQLLSEHAFFSPNLNVFPNKKTTTKSNAEKLPQFAKKLRPLYQSGLLGLFRNTDVQNNLKLIATVIRQLENSVDSEKAHQLLWICGGVIEGLYNQGLEANISLKSLLGQVDRLIKKLIDEGEEVLSNEIPKELLKNLLYYVAQTKPKGSRVNELKEAFNLKSLLPNTDGSRTDSEIAGMGSDVIKNVSKAIKEDMLGIKESLDLFVRAEDASVTDLAPLCQKLCSVADTLGLLGMGKLRKLIKEQEKVVSEVISNSSKMNDSVIMGIASALLFVESSVNDLRLASMSEEDDSDDNSKLLPDSEYNQLVELTITEAKSVLARIKDAFIAFAADTSKTELLQNTPNLIGEIKGAFVIISFGRAADLINSCGIYIKQKLLESKSTPDQNELDALADVITGIEYFLENFAHDSSGARKSLDIAQESLVKLGFPPENIEPLTDDTEQAKSDKINIGKVENSNLHIEAADTSQKGDIESEEITSAFIEDDDDYDEDADTEILEIFLEEAEEELGSITLQLAKWQENINDDNALLSLRRSYHTLKGSGRIVGAIEIGEFAWSIESMLNRVIDKMLEPSPNLFALLAQAKDVLPEFIEQIRGKGAPTSNYHLIVENANKLEKGESIIIASLVDSTDLSKSSSEETSDVNQQLALNRPAVYDPVLVEIFTNETKTHIASIRHYIENCQIEGLPCQVNNDLIRALHTLHGSAHMAKVTDIAEISDQLEKYVKLAYENQTDITHEIITLLNDSIIAIEAMIGGLSQGTISLYNKDVLVAQTIALIDDELSSQKDRLGGLDKSIDTITGTNIDDELVEIFLKEACEILDESKATLSSWIQSPENIELADELRRHMHTLKGGAKISNLPLIAEVSGHIEDLLTQAIDKIIPISQELATLTEEAYHWTNEYIALQISKSPITPALALQKEELAKRADALSHGYTEDETSVADITFDEDLPVDTISVETMSDEYLGTDEELVSIFITEAQDILAQSKETLSQWSEQLDNLQLVEDLLRAMHMLKGGARMAKLIPIGDTTQNVEVVLMQIIDTTLQPSNEIVDTMLLAFSWTARAIESLVNKQNISTDDKLLSQLQAHLITSDKKRQDTKSLDTTSIGTTALEATSHEMDDIAELGSNISSNETLSFEDGSIDNISLDDFSLDDGLETPDEIDEPEEESEIVLSDFESNWDMDDSNDEQYDDDLADIFLEEATEILHKMDDLLQLWAGDPESKELIEEVQRALHTIKGGARMANIAPIGDLSHSIETVLEKIIGGHLTATPKLVEVVQSSYDWLNEALDKVRRNETLTPAKRLIDEIEVSVGLKKRSEIIHTEDRSLEIALDEQSDRLSAVFANDSYDEAEKADFEMVEFAEDAATEVQIAKQKDDQVKVSAGLLDNLVNFAGEVSIYRSRVDQQLGSINYNLTEFDQTVFRVKEQLRKFEIEAEAQILFRYEGSNIASDNEDFDPLELDRFSNMQQLSRSLVESLGDLSSIKKLLENYTRETEILLLQQSRVSSELQEGLIRTRLIPFSSAVPRLRRIIRQTAKELGKQTEFKVTGTEGEMDRNVLDRVVPALEHMLRNAIDHGIEMPDIRTAAGKSKAGRIMLSFKLEGAKIYIRIQDDGHGMNLKAIRDKAIERNLMAKDSDLSDNEVMQFVLESGFSTAKKVTQISGRGVGMDVVNTEIKQVAGTLHIDSKEGKGSIFTIQLPLTVSANQALLIETGDDKFAIPLSSVDGVIRVSGRELDKLYSNSKPIYKYGGREYGFFHLGSILGLSKPQQLDPAMKVPLILARAGDHSVALLVERIVGRQEIVIKSVGPQISTVNGISGATIMGDGGVALILDISSLIREGIAHMVKVEVERERLEAERAARSSEIPLIMVVDDSITVRKVTERLLKRHNMESITAKDGIDALDKLQEQIPDVMLLDVEMPRMDGFELATAMRNDDRLKNIPIIMITSRTGDKHRERAAKIGVDAYLGKPFQETELLENIETILKTSER